MTDYTLLKALEAVVTVVSPSARVIFPNEPVDALDDATTPFYEVFVSGRELTRETETAFVSSAVGTIVITGAQNTGAGELDDLAEEIVWNFSPFNPSVYDWFADVETQDDETTTQAYITGVKRSETGTYNNRFKITIFIDFEIYEGKKTDARL